jgi:hypothetical protein
MEKRRWVQVVVVAATFCGGLEAARADAPGPDLPPPAHSHARKKQRAQKAVAPKVSDKCATDADCDFTAMADGECCPTLCPRRVVSKTSAEALAKYAAVCKKPEGGCPVPECAPPRITTVAACVSGKCVARAAPGPMRE